MCIRDRKRPVLNGEIGSIHESFSNVAGSLEVFKKYTTSNTLFSQLGGQSKRTSTFAKRPNEIAEGEDEEKEGEYREISEKKIKKENDMYRKALKNKMILLSAEKQLVMPKDQNNSPFLGPLNIQVEDEANVEDDELPEEMSPCHKIMGLKL
eukprot:TRINITY_DN20606_c0_g1_i1.p1 TRINITY_DN20606_c0_g1~~TRINITY_DN20606_c0_g1_i1.p1  ORF type:complete len:171 (+),score=45.98 TRINITY_DN20606_c0_g1_i1:60-515(+)